MAFSQMLAVRKWKRKRENIYSSDTVRLIFFFRLSKMPVLQISKPPLQSFVIFIVFAVLYAMMTIYDFSKWDIIIRLLAIVSLACLAYIAYISYVATIVFKTLVSKLLKKKETYEKRKSEKKISWNMYFEILTVLFS